MKKFNVELKQEVEVEFSSVNKAKKYFIKGDWKDFFYAYENLEELASDLALNFSNPRGVTSYDWVKGCYTMFIEGFGEFISTGSCYDFSLTSEEFGTVKIKVCTDMYVDYVLRVRETNENNL